MVMTFRYAEGIGREFIGFLNFSRRDEYGRVCGHLEAFEAA